jgi:hypothetical protein
MFNIRVLLELHVVVAVIKPAELNKLKIEKAV